MRARSKIPRLQSYIQPQRFGKCTYPDTQAFLQTPTVFPSQHNLQILIAKESELVFERSVTDWTNDQPSSESLFSPLFLLLGATGVAPSSTSKT